MEVDLNKKRVLTKRDVLSFGKYKGKTIGYVLEEDPGWLCWACASIEWFELDDDVHQEAEEARHRQHKQDRNTPRRTTGRDYNDSIDNEDEDDEIPF